MVGGMAARNFAMAGDEKWIVYRSERTRYCSKASIIGEEEWLPLITKQRGFHYK
jgi:hypothetical protein